MNIVALAGGTGAAKLVRGLARLIDPRELTVIVNTGDDALVWGLHVSPDLDTICYALAGALDTARGWGLRDESFHALATWRASASRPGSISATAIWPPTCTAHDSSAKGER